ncbi:uncharacterized protein LOC104901743 isoform X2 [Beta vulgaris subsp. vulgaris]|uniref:uncharacterized protein LOC104901743 isoform X2 n=1 Tax=Beta vulgaris subsp. vulgaris TaxID=3555 RepID=UPI0020375BB6|nr:uncharacterized protein LOC104901743 isoform X2 [Beta vulgaris subsp. vulgaris]
MSNRREKEGVKERHAGGGGCGLPCENASTGRLTRSGRSSNITTRKCSTSTVPCSTIEIKKPDKSSEAARKPTKARVSVTESTKSGAVTVPLGVSRVRASQATANFATNVSPEVKRIAATEAANEPPAVKRTAGIVAANASPAVKCTAATVAQSKARGRQERAQVTRTPVSEEQPNPYLPDNKTKEKTLRPHQIWKEKSQPESTSRKEFSARKQQLQISIDNSMQSTQKTNSNRHTNKSKMPAIQKQVSRKEPLRRVQSSKGKQVEHRVSTSSSDLESESYLEHHIVWNGLGESGNLIGVCCCLCEEDLGVAPYEVESECDYGFSAIPIVAILPCGHAFHSHCLWLGELEGPGEPPCIFCESFASS